MRIIDNLILILVLCIMLGGIAYAGYKFFKKPKKEQVEAVKQWLIYACLQAEQLFGSKTGTIKLRYVYDNFVVRFPWLAQVITFEYFSSLVKEMLKKLEEELKTNDAVRNLIPNSNEGAE